jgi:hypothetical protein
MRRSFLPIIVTLLFYASAFTQAGPQRVFVSCSRPTIESYPDNESSPVLQYLDESRQVADEFMRVLAEGKFDEIYSLNIGVRIWVQAEPANIEMDLATFEQKQGKITHYEYRNQQVVYDIRMAEIDLRGRVNTWYEVKTAKSGDNSASLLVETQKAGEDNRIRYEGIFFKEMGRETIPGWLGEENTSKERDRCYGMRESLKVRGR